MNIFYVDFNEDERKVYIHADNPNFSEWKFDSALQMYVAHHMIHNVSNIPLSDMVRLFVEIKKGDMVTLSDALDFISEYIGDNFI